LDRGIWLDGRLSEEELDLFEAQIRKAVLLFRAGENKLPYHYRGSKLDFHAVAKDSELHVFFGWNSPPSQYWSKEEKDRNECLKCVISSSGTAQREVWCKKLGYDFSKCPYGVTTRR